MKNIAWADEPPRGTHRRWTGWIARTQWRGRIFRRRFPAEEADKVIYRQAVAWLRRQNKAFGKPTTDRWIRSRGVWGRGRKRGAWVRG
jgi:hypothetical protein